MAYSQEIYLSAMATVNERRARAEAEARGFRLRMLTVEPRLGEIERQIAAAAEEVARAIMVGKDLEQTVAAIQERNLDLQAEMATLLEQAGESRRNFQPQYTCSACEDTGRVEGRLCDCLKSLMREEACRRLSRMAPMGLTSFADLTPDYYPNEFDPRLGQSYRERMVSVLEYCRRYAAGFTLQSPSLLVSGPTGVGKTHTVLAIAKEATERGYSVVYGPAGTLLGQLEKEHFGKVEGDSESVFLDCDLLILDDLGTEFTGPFYAACLYNLVNSRLLAGRPTIVSTNLSRDDLLHRYGEQTASRMLGAYEPLQFFGKDIRQIKAARRMQGRD